MMMRQVRAGDGGGVGAMGVVDVTRGRGGR